VPDVQRFAQFDYCHTIYPDIGTIAGMKKLSVNLDTLVAARFPD
jgi:hypothetical protein